MMESARSILSRKKIAGRPIMATFEEIEKKNEEIVDDLFRALNVMSNEKHLAKALIERVKKEHPTLQQGFMGVLAAVIQAHGEREYTDARNEVSVKWAKEVSKIPHYFPFI